MDIIFETKGYVSYSSDYPNLFASEYDKPRIENGTCIECENLCVSKYGEPCRNITISGATFFVTLYHDQRYPDGKITFTNIIDAKKFGT